MEVAGHEYAVEDIDALSLVDSTGVHRDIYLDPRIFEAEMRRIFMRTWVYVGHDTEIPRQGDYKLTWIGTQPVIISRDLDGRAHVVLNRCSHRGAAVCRLAKGNARSFRCQYHGWTFGLDGELIGVTYPDGYDNAAKDGQGLYAVPRVESYRGFIFASFKPDVPPLAEHLREVLLYIDQFIDYAGGYDIEVAADANEALYESNWKLQVENNVDGYHLSFAHRSLFAVLEKRLGNNPRYMSASKQRAGATESFPNGHSVMDLRSVASDALRDRLDALPGAPPPGTDLDAFFGINGAEKIYLASPGPAMNICIFPNLNLGSINICEVHPIAVGRTRVVLRPLLLRGAPDGINRLRLRYHELGSGPAGFVQPDDLEMFERVGDGLTAASDRLRLDRGLGREAEVSPGRRRGHLTDETPQRGQYRRWRELMGVRP